MPRPSEPSMRDPADKDIHRKEGIDPYPVPRKTEEASQPEADTADPARTDPDAPHDRGTAPSGGYTTGVDAMKNKLKEEGEIEDWKEGRTQGAPTPKR
jgi:hypothetical protein